MNATFAERLKYAMEQADMSQSALSEKAGASKAAISQYLSGKNNWALDRVEIAYTSCPALAFVDREEEA